MFNMDDRVIHKDNLFRGTVLEVCDGWAYLELDNGVEMEFPVSELMLESEYKSPEEKKREEMETTNTEKLAIAELILPEIRSILVTLGRSAAEQGMLAVIAIGGSATPWDELNAFHKMNFISVATGVPFEQWETGYHAGTLANVQLLALANIGEALKNRA